MDLICKKISFIIFAYFILFNIFSSNKSIEVLSGINYYEEAHIVIALTQVSPIFIFKFIIGKNLKYFYLKHELYSHINIFSIYLKNLFVYWTDKTINIDTPIQYNLNFNFKMNSYLSLFNGIGILSKLKYNRYSSGLNYWQSELKYTLVPLFIGGIQTEINRYKFIISNYLGFFPSFIFQYKKEEYYNFFIILNFYNNLKIDFFYYFNKKIYMILSYSNFLDLYVDILVFFGFVNFNNCITIGIGYEI